MEDFEFDLALIQTFHRLATPDTCEHPALWRDIAARLDSTPDAAAERFLALRKAYLEVVLADTPKHDLLLVCGYFYYMRRALADMPEHYIGSPAHIDAHRRALALREHVAHAVRTIDQHTMQLVADILRSHEHTMQRLMSML